jgi:hypothetical protein
LKAETKRTNAGQLDPYVAAVSPLEPVEMQYATETQPLGEFARRGFTLKHPDSHVVELYHEDELIARFSQLGATKESLQAECAKHLAEKHDNL